MSQRYYLIKPIEVILGSKLPSRGDAVGRLLQIQANSPKQPLRDAAKTVCQEINLYWQKAAIPTKREDHIIEKLLSLYKEYNSIKKGRSRKSKPQLEKESNFSTMADNLFDIAQSEALSMIKIEEDATFFLAQREPGRRGTIDSLDTTSAAKQTRKYLREISETSRKAKADTEAALNKKLIELASSASSSSESELPGNEASTSAICTLECAPVTKRAKLNLITPSLAASLDCTKMSDRNAVYVQTETAAALGHDAAELNINRSSIRRQRLQHRTESVNKLKSEFNEEGPFIVYWDGKLMQDLTSKEHIDRLPILISWKNCSQLLSVAKLPNGSGECVASAVVEAVSNWGLQNKICRLSFDTTSSNTGHKNGACTLIERKLETDLLHLACRHHIMELIIQSVFNTIMGPTKSPNVSLFERFQEQWEFIDRGNYCTLKEENISESKSILTWATDTLIKSHQKRDDYREFLELGIIILGGIPPRGIHIMALGAMHHARWMSKVIYSLKVWMFKAQFKLTQKEEQGLTRIVLFIVKIYMKIWNEAPLPISAPRNDLATLKLLHNYEKDDESVANAALQKFLNHQWYLSEELVALAFFDDDVLIATKERMASSIKQQDSEEEPMKRVKILRSSISSASLPDFCSKSTLGFFQKLKLNSDFLQEDPKSWDKRADFKTAQNSLIAMSVVNDHAERSVALIQEYSKILIKNEDQLQFVLQVVQNHRKLFPDSRKSTLSKTRPQ